MSLFVAILSGLIWCWLRCRCWLESSSSTPLRPLHIFKYFWYFTGRFLYNALLFTIRFWCALYTLIYWGILRAARIHFRRFISAVLISRFMVPHHCHHKCVISPRIEMIAGFSLILFEPALARDLPRLQLFICWYSGEGHIMILIFPIFNRRDYKTPPPMQCHSRWVTRWNWQLLFANMSLIYA